MKIRTTFRHTFIATFLMVIGMISSNVIAAGNIQLVEVVTLKAKPAAVWALVGDFNGLYRWHPAITTSALNNKVRVLTLNDGAEITEILLEQDDTHRSYSYAITKSPLPVTNYEAKISVTPNGENGSVVTWAASFNASGVSDIEAEEFMRGVFKAGLENLEIVYN